MEVTVNLSDKIYQSFKQLAEKTNRRVDEVIAEKIQTVYSIENTNNEQAIADLSDEDVLALAKLKLPEVQERRMSELLDLQQKGEITSAEKRELEVYTELYDIANLHKAQGGLEAVNRGLIKTPADLK